MTGATDAHAVQAGMRLCFVTLLALSMTGCAMFGGGKGVDFSCVLDDDRLGAPFRDPDRAREWLVDTLEYLRDARKRIAAGEWQPTDEDLRRLADLADLADRAAKCIDMG